MLYLSSASTPRTAAGFPLAFGTLTFYRSGTTQLADVYDAEDLETALPNPVEADSEGVWPDIWLDPDVTYRVVLSEASGVLAYDVAPYLPYEGGPFRYLDAQVQATPGASLTFEVDGQPAAVYADGDLSAALPNPVRADSGGRFPPIYLDDSLTYDVNGQEYPPA